MNRALRALVTAWADAVKDALQPIRDILPVHLLMNPDPLRSHPIHPEETPMNCDPPPDRPESLSYYTVSPRLSYYTVSPPLLSGGIPDRTFVDDLGRRWEWCGGEEGTWAWRVTHLRPVIPSDPPGGNPGEHDE